eukprot:482400-Pleurochrysis_carterae.AAC.1
MGERWRRFTAFETEELILPYRTSFVNAAAAHIAGVPYPKIASHKRVHLSTQTNVLNRHGVVNARSS